MKDAQRGVLPPPDWCGEMGETWHRLIDVFESMIASAGTAAIAHAAVGPGERVVDVGCGGGLTTLDLARRVGPRGEALGVDIAPKLIDLARDRARGAGLDNARFVAADAATWSLDAPPFDCLFSRFGVMFFDDPVAAFTNMRGWLAPGGRLALACWGPPPENPWIRDLMSVAGRFIDLPKPDLTQPGMFSFSDQERVRGILEAAGFEAPTFTPWRGEQWVGGAGATPEQAADFAVTGTPLGDLVKEHDEATGARVRQALVEHLAAHATPEGIPRPGLVWLVSARA